MEATRQQLRQIHRFAEDAVEKELLQADLDKEDAQRVIEHGDKFVEMIRNAVRDFFIDSSSSDQSASKEVPSGYAYPPGYKVKSITEQIKILHEFFPGSIWCADGEIAEQPLPACAEGWFAIPKWQTMAATYGEAVEKVLAMIASKRKFCNYRNGQLGAKYLRRHEKSIKMFQKLGQEQKDFDILVVPAQFGLRHRGRSVRWAREVMNSNSIEFGLGTFAIGIMLLTHPEREVEWEQLHIDCAGDEFAPEANGVFSHAPIFHFHDRELKFNASWFDRGGYGRYGSASGFLY